MDTIERIARRNRLRAEEVIRDSRLAEIWRSVGAEVRQVGSLRSGLLMKHRDIDFHIYSSPLRLEESFTAMAQLAADILQTPQLNDKNNIIFKIFSKNII